MPQCHAAPAYQKHASGQARVTIKGKDHYLGKYGSPESKARYEKLVRRHLANRLRDEMASSVALVTDITVNEAAVRYLAHAEQYYVKNGVVTNQVRMIRLARPGRTPAVRRLGGRGVRSQGTARVPAGFRRAKTFPRRGESSSPSGPGVLPLACRRGADPRPDLGSPQRGFGNLGGLRSRTPPFCEAREYWCVGSNRRSIM